MRESALSLVNQVTLPCIFQTKRRTRVEDKKTKKSMKKKKER
jgi:hypothetical protein